MSTNLCKSIAIVNRMSQQLISSIASPFRFQVSRLRSFELHRGKQVSGVSKQMTEGRGQRTDENRKVGPTSARRGEALREDGCRRGIGSHRGLPYFWPAASDQQPAAKSRIYKQDAFLAALTVSSSIGFHEALIFIGYCEGGVVQF